MSETLDPIWTHNFKHARRGDDFKAQLAVRNSKKKPFKFDKVSSILMQVKISEDIEDNVLVFSSEDNSLIFKEGYIELIKDRVSMSNITPGGYIYDMQFTLNNGVVLTYMRGTFLVKGDITR